MARAIAGRASLVHKAISFLSSKSSREIHLKKEQGIAIESLLKEKDVLAVLPTGFGKSLVFQVFAIITSMDSVSSNGCVLVICPPKSIIRDQIEEDDSLGLNAVELESPDMFENLPRLPDIYCICFGRSGVHWWVSRCNEKTTGCSLGDCRRISYDKDVGRRNLVRTYSLQYILWSLEGNLTRTRFPYRFMYNIF